MFVSAIKDWVKQENLDPSKTFMWGNLIVSYLKHRAFKCLNVFWLQSASFAIINSNSRPILLRTLSKCLDPNLKLLGTWWHCWTHGPTHYTQPAFGVRCKSPRLEPDTCVFWTGVFEIYTAFTLKTVQMKMILPPEQQKDFNTELQGEHGREKAVKQINEINVMDARAWSDDDMDKVKGMILRSEGGPDAVNKIAKECLQACYLATFEKSFRKSVADKQQQQRDGAQAEADE